MLKHLYNDDKIIEKFFRIASSHIKRYPEIIPTVKVKKEFSSLLRNNIVLFNTKTMKEISTAH